MFQILLQNREWVSRRSLGDVCLATPEACSECRTFLRDVISSWLHKEYRQARCSVSSPSDLHHTSTLRLHECRDALAFAAAAHERLLF
jgi:hypothetical protein